MADLNCLEGLYRRREAVLELECNGGEDRQHFIRFLGVFFLKVNLDRFLSAQRNLAKVFGHFIPVFFNEPSPD